MVFSGEFDMGIVMKHWDGWMVRVLCGMEIEGRSGDGDLLLMSLIDTSDQLGQAHLVRWCGFVLGGEAECILQGGQ